ncbi:MAG: DUF262 domain-containing protein [Chloroflexi bacterium]|nr:DUF262 domain-containing protein [Chloroflexota bacterium]
MSGFRNYAKVETWTVSELIDATSLNPRGNRKVTIPEFQRRLVWSPSKQMALIDSIKMGYPIGSLLMYKVEGSDGNKETYKLIDGLQRTQSLRNYASHPNQSFSKSDLPGDLMSIVASQLNFLSDVDCLSKRSMNLLRDVIVKWIWDGQGFQEADGWSINSLTNTIILKVLGLEEDTYEFYKAGKELLAKKTLYREPILELLDAIKMESDITGAEVPILIYTGASSELPTVFSLLNSQGTSLTRYEIYAAKWLDHRQPIDNPNIIDAIWKKYAELEKHGFDLDVSTEAPNEQSRRNRNYTLFEYLFGLGQHLSHDYPRLFKSVEVDKPSSVGFNLMSACLEGGVVDKDMRKLPERIRGLQLQTLEKYLLESTDFVNSLLMPILSMQRKGQTKTPYIHGEMQIISMIASAFRVRYNQNNLSELAGWQESRDTLATNLPMYFLYDILRESWRGSGDSNLHDIISNQLYLTSPPTQSGWMYELDAWFDYNVNKRKHTKRYIKDDYSEHLLLRYIYAQKLKIAETYLVEYIVPASQLLAPPSFYSKNKGPINTIGNFALVAEEDHTDMGDQTFVEYLNRRQGTGAIRGPGRYYDELKQYQNLLICSADILPSELTQESFERFLRQRFKLLKSEFIRVWRDHIPTDPQT